MRTVGLLKKLLFFFCLAFWSSGFSPDEDSLGIGGNFTHCNLRLTVCPQVPNDRSKIAQIVSHRRPPIATCHWQVVSWIYLAPKPIIGKYKQYLPPCARCHWQVVRLWLSGIHHPVSEAPNDFSRSSETPNAPPQFPDKPKNCSIFDKNAKKQRK